MQNRFDELSAQWDENPMRREIASSSVTHLRKKVQLAKTMHALDYGCGTGLVLLGIQPYVGSIEGMDFSQGMLQTLQEKIKNAGLSNIKLSRHNMDTDSLPESSFDLITSSMTLHHIKDPRVFITKTYMALKTNGYLCFTDLETEDGSFHPENITDYEHKGFDREEIESYLKEAGFQNISIEISYTASKVDSKYPIFTAIAQK